MAPRISGSGALSDPIASRTMSIGISASLQMEGASLRLF
jgi:hypothetical protein